MAFLCLSVNASASTIIEVTALSNQILVVHFDDGFVNYHKNGESRQDETAIIDPLNLTLAGQNNQFTLISGNDANYTLAKNAASLNRKSKPTNFTWLCEGWDGNCVNTSPDHADEHWIYVFLPTPMVSGKDYTLNTSTLATNGSTWNFTFDEKKNRSEAVHVNMEGYHPEATKKFGYLYHWAGDKGSIDFSTLNGKPFNVVKISDLSVVFTGNVAFRKDKFNQETGQGDDTPNQNFAGSDVWELLANTV
jgi:endoglucanase